MHATHALRQWCIRTTLYIRPNCSLCVEAKSVLDAVWQRRPFEYSEINILAPKQKKWKDVYEFDVPVVHVDKVKEGDLTFQSSLLAGKLMHRFTEAEVEKLMDEEMMKPPDDDDQPS